MTFAPTTSVRAPAPGGVPVEAGLTAPTLPTFCCCAPACDSGATVVSRNVSSRVRYEGVRQSINLPLSLSEHDLLGKPVPTFPDHALEARRRPDHDREVVLGVILDVR